MRPMMALEEERPLKRRKELFCVCTGSDVYDTRHELSAFRFRTKDITLNISLKITLKHHVGTDHSLISDFFSNI